MGESGAYSVEAEQPAIFLHAGRHCRQLLPRGAPKKTGAATSGVIDLSGLHYFWLVD